MKKIQAQNQGSQKVSAMGVCAAALQGSCPQLPSASFAATIAWRNPAVAVAAQQPSWAGRSAAVAGGFEDWSNNILRLGSGSGLVCAALFWIGLEFVLDFRLVGGLFGAGAALAQEGWFKVKTGCPTSFGSN